MENRRVGEIKVICFYTLFGLDILNVLIWYAEDKGFNSLPLWGLVKGNKGCMLIRHVVVYNNNSILNFWQWAPPGPDRRYYFPLSRKSTMNQETSCLPASKISTIITYHFDHSDLYRLRKEKPQVGLHPPWCPTMSGLRRKAQAVRSYLLIHQVNQLGCLE